MCVKVTGLQSSILHLEKVHTKLLIHHNSTADPSRAPWPQPGEHRALWPQERRSEAGPLVASVGHCRTGSGTHTRRRRLADMRGRCACREWKRGL